MLIFIAFFVYLAASSESASAQMKDVTAGMAVSEAMVTEMKVLPASATLEDAIDAVLRTSQHEFPIIDDAGHVLGQRPFLVAGDVVDGGREIDPPGRLEVVPDGAQALLRQALQGGGGD